MSRIVTDRAVFFDRDGVIVADLDDHTTGDLVPFDGLVPNLRRLKEAEWRIVVVTNQPVVARGLMTEADVERAHVRLGDRLEGCVEAFLYCPHHPNGDLAKYRVRCECRKPRDGMLRDAARILGIDLGRSVMVGDRMTDIEAGHRAGCRTVLVTSGMHDRPRIQSPEVPLDVTPGHVAADVFGAIEWVLTSE